MTHETKKIVLRIPHPLDKRATAAAAHRGVSYNQYILQALEKYTAGLENKYNKGKPFQLLALDEEGEDE